jgi:hypothetical protein
MPTANSVTYGEQIWAKAIQKVGFWRFPEPAIMELGKELIAAINDLALDFISDMEAMETHYEQERKHNDLQKCGAYDRVMQD